MNSNLSLEDWWKSLSPQWRQAFRMSVLSIKDEPTPAQLKNLLNMQVLRLAGPSAPHPNCTFEFTDLSGIAALTKLHTLIVVHHAIELITEVSNLQNLRALFLYNNKIKSLRGIEDLKGLEQLYVQSNELQSINEIERLLNLKELYLSDNKITSLTGLTVAHADRLKKLVCLPNENLKQKEIIHAERELGIICR